MGRGAESDEVGPPNPSLPIYKNYFLMSDTDEPIGRVCEKGLLREKPFFP